MLLNIILKNIQSSILNLRLYIGLVLTILLFSVGSIAFLKSNNENRDQYTKFENEYIEEMRMTANNNISNLAIRTQSYILKPLEGSFITDAKENYYPGKFNFSAYNVFGFDPIPGGTNPHLNVTPDLNWVFIISVIISFFVLVFTFDSISGEKELKTLALSFSNSLSRSTYLFGIYLSSIIISMLVIVPGICISLMILLVSGSIALTAEILIETTSFIVVTGIFIACIAAFGLLSSVITRSSRVSLLYALTFWIVFTVAIPNTALFWANTFFTIDPVETVDERISSTLDDIERSGVSGRWSASDGNPFLPNHEIRAEHQFNRMDAEKRIRDEYYQSMFHQFDQIRMITALSPIALYERLTETIVGGGYVRFRNVWDDLHIFQTQFLAWFKAKDATDPDSPHWYNPYEDYSTSKKPVNFEEVPLFEETPPSIGERLVYGGPPFVLLVTYTIVLFALSYVLFLRYDVR